jgi:bifunctional oligoribonuclease and PAP phosphatase NrnA
MERSAIQSEKELIDTFERIVDTNKKFVLTTHVNPDGDGLGSELALNRYLNKIGKQSAILNHSETPSNHTFLDYNDEIRQFVPERDANLLLDADVLMALDMNNSGRLKSLEKYFLESKAKKVIIDHHLEAQDFVDYKLIDLDSPATAEIVYRCLSAYDPKLLDKGIAEALYAGIMTDTGSFRFPRTDGDVHRITAHLLDLGVDPFYVYHNLYEENSLGRTRLLGEMLSKVELAYDGRVSRAVITLEQLKRNGVVPDDVDNFVNQAGAIAGVVVTLFFLEMEDGVKISFRSKGDIPVNELAKMYGGGGHKNASGARLTGVKLDETVRKVVSDAGTILKI